MTGAQILSLLAPTLRTMDHLERLYAAAQQRGENVEADLKWLARWRDIFSDGASVVDGVSGDVWTEVGGRVAG